MIYARSQCTRYISPGLRTPTSISSKLGKWTAILGLDNLNFLVECDTSYRHEGDTPKDAETYHRLTLFLLESIRPFGLKTSNSSTPTCKLQFGYGYRDKSGIEGNKLEKEMVYLAARPTNVPQCFRSFLVYDLAVLRYQGMLSQINKPRSFQETSCNALIPGVLGLFPRMQVISLSR